MVKISIPVCKEFDGTKVFCHIFGIMHMTWKIASEEQDESMADIELPPLKIKTFQPYNHWRMFNTSLKAKDSCNKAMSIGDAVDGVTSLKLASSTQTTLHDFFNNRKL